MSAIGGTMREGPADETYGAPPSEAYGAPPDDAYGAPHAESEDPDRSLISTAREAVVAENRWRAARWDAVSRFHAARVAEHEAAGGQADPGAGWFGLTALQATVLEFAPLFAVQEISVQITLDIVDGIKRAFPRLWRLCLAGRLDLGRAQLCWEQLSHLTCPADKAAFAELVEDYVARRDDPDAVVFPVTRAALSRAVRRMCLKFPQHDPSADFAAAFKKRNVRLRTEESGMSFLSGGMPVHEGMVADYRLTLIAKRLAQEPGETRTLEHLRADVLVDLVVGRLTVSSSVADLEREDASDDDSGDASGVDPERAPADRDQLAGFTWSGEVGGFARPVVHVTVSIQTLLGLADEPGLLSGGESVPAELARLIAGGPGSTWYRLLTDEAGDFSELSTQAYAPSAPIWRWTVARDQTCRWPGCTRPASVCESDHRVPYPLGATSTDNLESLCRRHHRFKHSEGVSVRRDSDGSHTWTTRFGSTFRTPPPDYPTGTHDGRSTTADEAA